MQKIEAAVKLELLRFLPAKSLYRFRAVSKEWDHEIQKPLLAVQQGYHFTALSGFFYQDNHDRLSFLSLDHQAYGVPDPSLSFLHEDIRILSSSNGLLLCQKTGDDLLYVCNPATRKLKTVWYPASYSFEEPAMVLGFEPSAVNMESNYHLVNAVKNDGEPVVRFEIYSSKTGRWRESESLLCLDEATELIFTGNTFYFKGIAYWETGNKTMVAFDLKIDEGEIVALPGRNGTFGQSNGEICYLCFLPEDQYLIQIYNLAKKEWQHHIRVNVDQSLTGDPRILPGFDGKTVMVHMGRSIYSFRTDDDHADAHPKLVADVPMQSIFADRCSIKYFDYVNSLVPILT